MKNYHRFLFAFALLLLSWQTAAGQGTVQGTVTDANSGETLPGVQVVIAGMQLGSVTDLDGRYSIANVPAGEQEVQARFIGFRNASETVQVADGETVTVDFALRESVVDLDEVVVTGTGGPVEKRKLGNSIASINAQDLDVAPVQSFSEIIQGREPGMVALPSGGLSGEGTRIRIRGSASLSQSNEPVVYVDGVRVNNGGGFGGLVAAGGGGSPSRLDDISPESIERVEVLKGAAAATLFGTEASNGVIQVFTRSGTQGAPKFSFASTLTGIRYPSAYPDQVGFARPDAVDEETGEVTFAQADTLSRYFGRTIQPYELVSQNIPEALIGTGFAQEYAGTASGGAEGITYFLSARYLDEDGPLQQTFIGDREYASAIQPRSNDRVRRAQGTATLNITPGERFQIRVSTGYSDSFLSTLQTNNNIYGTISLAQFSKPELVRYNNRSGTIAFATVNESVQQTVEQTARHFYGTTNLDYRFSEALGLNAIFGIDYTNTASEEVRPFGWNIDDFATDTPEGFKAFASDNTFQLSGDLKAKHQVDLSERFESDLTVGAQAFYVRSLVESGSGTDFPGPGFEVTEAAAQQVLFETFGEVVNIGIFGQEQVGFDDYLFLTVGARYDVNSAFGSEFSGVLYPKASLSFIPSDAPFWDGGSYGPLSSLRLRAAIGQAGLQPGTFAALTTYGSLSSATGAGVVTDNLGNPDLQPEVSTEWEVGGEIGLFDGAAVLETTYWNRVVNDAIVSRQFPVTGGFRSTQAVNIGSLKAQGLELGLQAYLFERDNISVDVFANTSYLYEQVTDLGGAPPIKVGGSYPRYRNYLVEDFAPGAHFGVQLLDVPEGQLPVDFDGDGSPDSRQQVLDYLAGLTPEDASLPSSTARVLLATREQSPTGNSRDFYLGKPTPDFQGSFGLNVDFLRNFTVSTLFEYKAGNYYVNNLTDAFRQANASIGRNLPESARVERDYITGGVDAQGTPQNDPDVRLAALEEWLGSQLALAPFAGLNSIKPADFVRFRELSFTYRVPGSFLERYGLRSLAFTAAGRNLALWTRYDGVDPELNAIGRAGGDGVDAQLDNNFLDGVEAFGFPVPRRFSFKMRVGF